MPAVSPDNSAEQSQRSSPAENSSEFTHPPLSSAGCVCEHFQPLEDCIPLSLPEPNQCNAQLLPASTLPGASLPAGSVPVSAGESEGPLQPSAVCAGGSVEPSRAASERVCPSHCLSLGWPPDRLCRRHCLQHGRPPELFSRRRCRLHGWPPELCPHSCCLKTAADET